MRLVGILIHGTFAGPRPDAKQWYELSREQPDSFIARLESALRARGTAVPDLWQEFSWSGANAHADRVSAAEKLYQLLRSELTTSPDSEFLFIAHSHGGNVALKALELLWKHNPEADSAFEEILRATATQRLTNRDAARQFIESSARLANVSAPMRAFLQNAVFGLAFLSRTFMRRPPRDKIDPEGIQNWIMRALKSPFVGALREPFSVRWSTERRPRVCFVTMGTPFYQKMWLRRATIKAREQLILLVIVVALLVVAFVPVLRWVSDSAPWLRPLALLTVGVYWVMMVKLVVNAKRHNTNVYFNIPPPDKRIPKARSWRLCVIQSGFLDEALLALSAEPLLYAELGQLLKRPLGPRLSWASTPDATGESTFNLPFTLEWYWRTGRKVVGVAIKWLYNITLGFIFRFLGWVTAIVANRFLLKILLRSVSSTGFGVPEHEFKGARISVVGNPDLRRFFKQEMWVATQALIDEPPMHPTAADRKAKWGFLLSDGRLTDVAPSSQIWQRIKTTAPQLKKRFGLTNKNWLKRLSLALEERFREAAGLVPLNHSAYYSNTKVVEKIADFIANQPSASPPATASDITKSAPAESA